MTTLQDFIALVDSQTARVRRPSTTLGSPHDLSETRAAIKQQRELAEVLGYSADDLAQVLAAFDRLEAAVNDKARESAS